MKILLAVDGSEFSDAALAEVAARPWPAASEIKVVSAFELPLPIMTEAWAVPPEYFEGMERSARAQAKSVVEAATDRLQQALGDLVVVKGEFIQGSPKHAILDVAERWGADLIVMGSHGYRNWERFLLGSVSQAVVSHAHCSVEVVRCAH